MLAEDYKLDQIITAAVQRESSKNNAEALRARGSQGVSRMEETMERELKGGDLEAKINKMESELVEVKKLRRASTAAGTEGTQRTPSAPDAYICTDRAVLPRISDQ